jgi:pheromone shutdown protein TraB
MEGPVLLIGSAHVLDVEGPLRSTLGGRVLDGLAVELDAERAATVLSEGTEGASRRPGGPLFLRLWGLLQKRLGTEIGGGPPGSEMRTAALIARERNLPLFLIDDPIRETLGRLLRSISVRERISLLFGGVVGLVLPSRMVEQQLDDYTESPEAYLEEVRRAYPQVIRVLLDERNEHMADRLREIRHRGYGRVAAVVGDAHVRGLADALRRRGIPVETIALGELRATTGPSAGPAPAPG